MLSLTKRVDYGLIALTHLASASSSVSARELAAAHSLSPALLANVLKVLCGEDLVSSSRGKHGGYRLAVDPAFLSVQMVIEVLEGPFQLASCMGDEGSKSCEIVPSCTVKWSVNKIHKAIVGLLGGVTLADIVSDATTGSQRVLAEEPAGVGSFRDVPLTLEV